MLRLAQAGLLPRASLTESCVIHRELPWLWSLLRMGMLVSAVRRCSAPGATANRRMFAETTANCSQLGPGLEYSSAHGTSPNAFHRMAGNGGSGARGRRPATSACPAEGGDLYLRCFQGKGKRALGSSGLSRQLLEGRSGDPGILRDPSTPWQQHKCQPKGPFYPSPASHPPLHCDRLPLGSPKSHQLPEPGLRGGHKPKGKHQPDPATGSPQPGQAEDTRARAPADRFASGNTSPGCQEPLGSLCSAAGGGTPLAITPQGRGERQAYPQLPRKQWTPPPSPAPACAGHYQAAAASTAGTLGKKGISV